MIGASDEQARKRHIGRPPTIIDNLKLLDNATDILIYKHYNETHTDIILKLHKKSYANKIIIIDNLYDVYTVTKQINNVNKQAATGIDKLENSVINVPSLVHGVFSLATLLIQKVFTSYC